MDSLTLNFEECEREPEVKYLFNFYLLLGEIWLGIPLMCHFILCKNLTT